MGFFSRLNKLFGNEEEKVSGESISFRDEEIELEIDEEDKIVVALAASIMAGKDKNNSYYHISKIRRIK